jgi:hypothetical protein
LSLYINHRRKEENEEKKGRNGASNPQIHTLVLNFLLSSFLQNILLGDSREVYLGKQIRTRRLVKTEARCR